MYKFIRCPRCHGQGHVASKKQNGICFECNGSKQIRVTLNEYKAWKKKEDTKK